MEKPELKKEPESKMPANGPEYWKKEDFIVNGRRVEFHGVAHDEATWANPKYRKELEQAIHRASLVVLEVAPVAGALTSDSGEDMHFFKKVEETAAKERKLVAVIDPKRDYQSATSLNRLDRAVHGGKVLINVGGALALLRLYQKERKVAKEKQETEAGNKNIKFKNDTPMARRTFLRSLAGAGSALVGSSLFAEHYQTQEETIGRKRNPLGAVLYDEVDFRDVSIAETLDRLTKYKNLPSGPLVMVYGVFHDSIAHYLRSPKERAAKFLAYAPYRKVGPPTLSLYEFGNKEDG